MSRKKPRTMYFRSKLSACFHNLTMSTSVPRKPKLCSGRKTFVRLGSGTTGRPFQCCRYWKDGEFKSLSVFSLGRRFSKELMDQLCLESEIQFDGFIGKCSVAAYIAAEKQMSPEHMAALHERNSRRQNPNWRVGDITHFDQVLADWRAAQNLAVLVLQRFARRILDLHLVQSRLAARKMLNCGVLAPRPVTCFADVPTHVKLMVCRFFNY